MNLKDSLSRDKKLSSAMVTELSAVIFVASYVGS